MRMNKKILPNFEAPTFSMFLAGVWERINPKSVTSDITQKEEEVRLNFLSVGKLLAINGTIKSAQAWASAVVPLSNQ